MFCQLYFYLILRNSVICEMCCSFSNVQKHLLSELVVCFLLKLTHLKSYELVILFETLCFRAELNLWVNSSVWLETLNPCTLTKIRLQMLYKYALMSQFVLTICYVFFQLYDISAYLLHWCCNVWESYYQFRM